MEFEAELIDRELEAERQAEYEREMAKMAIIAVHSQACVEIYNRYITENARAWKMAIGTKT